MHPDETIIQDIVRRIEEAAQPERIIMFGSAARGEMQSDSDVDLLVVKAEVHRGKTTREIYRRMKGAGYPVDIVVAHPEDIERYRESPYLVYREAIRGGRVIYER